MNFNLHEFNLIQCFYIIGLDYKNDFIQSKIISKFPYKIPYFFIDDEILINHVFPFGIKFNIKYKKPEYFFFNLPIQKTKTEKKYNNLYFFVYNFCEKIPFSINNNNNNENYYEKSFILSSFQNDYYSEFYQILSLIYSFNNNNNNNSITLESLIQNLIFDLPIPPPFKYKFEYSLPTLNSSKIIQFYQNPINKIPKCKCDLKILFKFFQIDFILEILKFILLEISILVFCENKYDLCNIIQSFCEIIYPLKYKHIVINILPIVYYKFIENFNVFIIGINEKFNVNFFDKININGKNVLIVDINSIKPNIKFFESKKTKKLLLILIKKIKLIIILIIIILIMLIYLKILLKNC